MIIYYGCSKQLLNNLYLTDYFMPREYPVKKASGAPATGHQFYEHLMTHLDVPATANHKVWFNGEKAKLVEPDKYAFRGDTPYGKTLEFVTLSGKELNEDDDNVVATDHGTYLVTFYSQDQYKEGSVRNEDGENVKIKELPIFVYDLAPQTKIELGIPDSARGKDKVFNPNFKAFDDLDEDTKLSNGLAALAIPKSISSWMIREKRNTTYSEKDVLNYLKACFENPNGAEMLYVMHANHMQWCALAYKREEGNVQGDLLTEFHLQQDPDYFVKDLGTILPGMFYALASLGEDPVPYFEQIEDELDMEIWGARDAAVYMRQYMRENQISKEFMAAY